MLASGTFPDQKEEKAFCSQGNPTLELSLDRSDSGQVLSSTGFENPQAVRKETSRNKYLPV